MYTCIYDACMYMQPVGIMAHPSRWLLAPLCFLCLHAFAQDTVLVGRVQSTSWKVQGEDGCPDPCGDFKRRTDRPAGIAPVCIDNGGGCESMVVKVERVVQGRPDADRREFRQAVGEWGPSLPPAGARVAVIARGDALAWSVAKEAGGKTLVDARRLGLVTSSAAGDTRELVDLDAALARGH